MMSRDSDSLYTSEEEEDDADDDDLSHSAASKCTIKSFTVKPRSISDSERGHERLVKSIAESLSRSPDCSETSDIESGTTHKIFQTNYIEINQQFGDVTVERTGNLSVGGTQNISRPGKHQNDEKLMTLKDKIYERTLSRIEDWTREMVNTSALDKVLEKLHSGIAWITIRGSPGEGKSTVAYMALDKLHKMGRQVYQVLTPEEFSEVSMTGSSSVIMMDDVFGNLEFDQVELTKWKPVLLDALREKEHRSHEKVRRGSKVKELTVILVGRDYVLNCASSDIGRMGRFFTHDMYVVDMSSTTERGLQEKHAIWRAISKCSDVQLGQHTTDRICSINVPHGFPHVCRLFVTLYQDDAKIDAERFFKSPLDFLNPTVQRFLRDKVKLFLFKEMVRRAGRISARDLQNTDNSPDMIDVAESLIGTYLRNQDGFFIFDHPSIYDCVVFNLYKIYPLFVIEYCNLSFIHERIRLESCDKKQESPSSETVYTVSVSGLYRTDLARRFASLIVSRNLLQVLSHSALKNKVFIEEMMAHIPFPLNQLIKLTDATTDEPFLSLCVRNKSKQLLMYIDNHPDTQLSLSDINTVVYGVCQYAASEVLTYLLHSRGRLDLNVRLGNGAQTPLMIAAMSRDSQFVNRIMSLNPDLSATDRWKSSVLHYLCENGLKESAEQVLDSGIDINAKNVWGRSSLWYALCKNETEVMRLLLDRGATTDARTIVDTCGRGNMDIVRLLFEKGAKVNNKITSNTPLTAASQGGHLDVVKFLIGKGASVNQAAGYGRTPLHGACEFNKGETTLFLLDVGADIHSVDISGNTALHTAVVKQSRECVDVLLEYGAQVNVRNSSGATPLHSAAGRRSKEWVDLLLEVGGDVDVEDHQGQTPLHHSVDSNHFGEAVLPDVSLCATLIKRSSDINKQDQDGNTALHLLCHVDHDTEMYKDWPRHSASLYEDVYRTLGTLFIHHGANINIVNHKGEPALRGWCQTLI